MKRPNTFAKFNERGKANSQLSEESPAPRRQMCGVPSRSAALRPAVFLPCILRLGKGVSYTRDLWAGFCFRFDLFMIRLRTELLQNVCYVPFGYVASGIYCIFC